MDYNTMDSKRLMILAAVALFTSTARTTANHVTDGLNQDERGSKLAIETSSRNHKIREVDELLYFEDVGNLKGNALLGKSRKRREPQLYPDDGSFGMRKTRSQFIIHENTEANSPQHHFDGWYPIGSGDPMSDDPTVEYEPPAVDQVHFSDGPMPEKPLYPILPENPPVLVMWADKNDTEVNLVYGKETGEQAFKPNENGNPIQLIAAPQFASLDESGSNSYDDENESSQVSYPSELSIDNNFGAFDLDSEFSEHYYVATRPRSGMAMASSAAPNGQFRGTSKVGNAQRLSNTRFDVVELFHDRSFRHPTTTTEPTRLPLHARLRTSGLHESQIEEAPYVFAASDNSGSFRQVAAPQFFNKQQIPMRKYLSKDKYNRKKESTSSRPSTRPWFLIETTIDDHNKNSEPAIPPYSQPEQHRGVSKINYKPYGPVAHVSKDDSNIPTHIHNPHLNDHMNSYKPTKSIKANSLSELLQIFQFTAVTENQETTTPRSFRYRYTPPTEESTITRSTDDALRLFATGYRYSASPSYENVDRTTETSVTTTSPTENLTKSEDIFEPVVDTNSSENITKSENIYDPVADTNSIDGYIIADSVDSHVYAQLESKTNKVNHNSKDTYEIKSSSKVSSTTVRPMVRPTVENIFKPEYVTESSRIPTFAEVMLSTKKKKGGPLYVIYQGHSKVKVFGANNISKKNRDKGSYVHVISTTPISTTTKSPKSFLNTKSQSKSTVYSSTLSTTPQSEPFIYSTTLASVTTTNQTLSTNSTSTSTVSTTTAPTGIHNINITEEEEYKDPLALGDVYEYYYDDNYDDISFPPSEYTDHDDITVINFGGNYPKESEDWVGNLNQQSYSQLPVDHPLHKLQTSPLSLAAPLDDS